MEQFEQDINVIRRELIPKLARLALIQQVSILALLVALTAMAYFAVTKRPEILGITDSGRVIPLIALDKPHVTDARVVGFAAECLQAVFSHDFVNYKGTMNEASKCFTSDGTASLHAAMGPLLTDINKRRMVLSSVVQPPTIVRKGTSQGVHQWALQTKITLYKEGTVEREVPRAHLVDLIIERVPMDESVRGIGLAKINVKPV